MMNICFLADARAEHARRWARYFAVKGHRVDLITLNPDTLDGYEPVRLHVVRKPNDSSGIVTLVRNLPPVLSKIKRILREIRPDVLHAHSASGYAWLAMLTGFHPYVITPWGTDILIDAQESWLIRILTSSALRRADLITCDGYNTRDALINLGVRADAIQLLNFGVDLKRFTKHPEVHDVEFRERYGLGDSEIVISTRTLTPIHDVATFVRAIPLIKRVYDNVCFVIVGDGPERENLEGLAQDLGVWNSVRFLGRVEEDDMARCLMVSDIYVSTSRADSGIAASTAEAMACQLPVVVTDSGDNREWVEEGTGGFVVPVGAPEVVAECVIRFLRNREMRLEFGRQNRLVIELRNNINTEMDRMEAIYERLAFRARNA